MIVLLAALLVNVTFAAQLVEVPGGQFKAFWIAPKSGEVLPPLKIRKFTAQSTPVTNAEFLKFIQAVPEWRKSRVPRIFADRNYLKDFKSDLKLSPGIKSNAPVVHVSYFAAQVYCAHLGMELPTTEEWEYIAAASESKADASRDPEFLSRVLEWYSEPNNNEFLGAVQQGKPNVYGIYDLHGLVWEWVADFNSNLVTGESREDGSLNRNLFCGAGGMGGGNKENYAAFMRFAFRASLKGKSTVWNLGFRCVRRL